MPEDTTEPPQALPETTTKAAGGPQIVMAAVKVPVLTILCHPDPGRVGEWAVLNDLDEGRDMELARHTPLFAPVRRSQKGHLQDPYVSRKPIRLGPEADGIVVDASGSPTEVVVSGSVLHGQRKLANQDLDHGVPLMLARRVLLLLRRVAPVARTGGDAGLVGESVAVVRLREKIARLGEWPYGVLLQGETGTGKELVAQAIHAASPRAGKKLVAFNVGAAQSDLVRSELFGYVRGAFTGADKDREGLFHEADGGTLFLDEIGDASAEVQTALLRVLESGELQRVGSTRTEKVDVRVVAATEVDLRGAVDRGKFRRALLERLNTTIFLPPLRDRLEDLGRLFFHFLDRDFGNDTPGVPAEIVERLVHHDWPGNVRELRKVVGQLMLASQGKKTMVWDEDVGRQIRESLSAVPPVTLPAPPPSVRRSGTARRHIDDVSEEEVLDALEAEDWVVERSVERVGVSKHNFYKLMRRFGIPKAKDLTAEAIEEVRERFPQDLGAVARTLKVGVKGLKERMKKLGIRP